MGRVDVEEMRRRDGSKTPSPDYDEIERSGIGMDGRILAGTCLVQRVADVAADIVEREGGRESDGGGHGCLPFFVIRCVTSGMGCNDVSSFTSSEQFSAAPSPKSAERTWPRMTQVTCAAPYPNPGHGARYLTICGSLACCGARVPCKASSRSESARSSCSRRKCCSRDSGDRHMPARR